MGEMQYEAIVIGSSAGGLRALLELLLYLPAAYPLPIIIVQHLLDGKDSFLADYLNEKTFITVKEADDKETIEKGYAYLAPPGYHLLIEDDHSLSLSMDPRVNFSRPSIDVLFESAAFVYEQRCIGIVLTGASGDGSQGLLRIKANGGLAIVQDPATAEFNTMPKSAIQATEVDHVLTLEEMGHFLISIAGRASV
jgi:two-component system, chemotaxis family, protein-glutamate methylesterase/glutaminase